MGLRLILSNFHQSPWSMEEHLKDDRMCDAFLSVAESRYPDLLATVRDHVARAMSGWMILHGLSAEVRWSDEDNCFVGRLKGFREEMVRFCGSGPTEMQAAFSNAVQDFVSGVTTQIAAGSLQDKPCAPTLADRPVVNFVKFEPRKRSRPRKRKK